MGLSLCSEVRTGQLRFAEEYIESHSEENNEKVTVKCNTSSVLVESPPEIFKKEEHDKKCFVSRARDVNSERKRSIDSTEDEKQITINTAVPKKGSIVLASKKNEGDIKSRESILSNSSDWMLEAAEGIDVDSLRKLSVTKPLPDLKNIYVGKQVSTETIAKEKHETQIMKLISEVLTLAEGSESDSYTSSHK